MKPAFPGFGAGHGVLHGGFGLALRAAGAGGRAKVPEQILGVSALFALLCPSQS